MRYSVKWEIDIETDEGPRAAAEEAFRTVQKVGTTANVFEVTAENEITPVIVDLDLMP